MQIAVIGSGIIGLTTAIRLQEVGHTVTIYTKQLFNNTTSAKVGAIWFPYHAEPLFKVNKWAGITYHIFKKQSLLKKSGVFMVPFKVLSAPGINNDWIQQLPPQSVRAANKHELPDGYSEGWVATVPLAEPPLYLPFLEQQFKEAGGKIIERSFTSLSELSKLEDVVVNCTGMGAKEICKDSELYPVRGQIVNIESQHLHSMVNSTEKEKLSYIIQRSDCTVLGGTDYENDYNETPNKEDTKLIIDRLFKLGVLSKAPIIKSEIAALRPKRSVIRCERDEMNKNIYHNYGHGGAGYTVSWGCAEEIADMIFKDISIKKP